MDLHEKEIEKIFTLFLGLLLGNNPDFRRVAIAAFCAFRRQPGSEVLAGQFPASSPEECFSLALTPLPPDKASRMLVQSLDDPKPEIRGMASDALKAIPPEIAARDLGDALTNYMSGPGAKLPKDALILTSEDGLKKAILALGHLNSPVTPRVLKKLLAQETNVRLKSAAISALSIHSDELTIPFFQGFLKDADLRIRANCLEAIQKVGGKSIVGILQPYLDDTHPRIKANAAKAIWKFGDFEVSSALREMLKHPDPNVRVSAIFAIGEIKSDAFFKSLITMINAPHEQIRKHSVIALRKFSRPEAFEIVLPRLSDESADVRSEAIETLVVLKKELCLPHLITHLKGEASPAVRAALHLALGRIGGNEGIQCLFASLKDHDESVLKASVQALEILFPQTAPQTVVTAFRELLDTHPSFCPLLIPALWRWNDGDLLQTIFDRMSQPDQEKRIMAIHCLGKVLEAVAKGPDDVYLKFDAILQKLVAGRKKQLSEEKAKAADSSVQILLKEASQALQSGNNVGAAEKIREILTLAPENLQGLITLGELLFQAGQIPEAEKHLQHALALQPNLGRIHLALGRLFHRRKQWSQARESLMNAVKFSPKVNETYLLLSEALEQEGRMKESHSVLKRLQGLLPQNGDIMLRLARASIFVDQLSEGAAWAEKAAKVGAQNHLSRVLLSAGCCLAGTPQEGYRQLFFILLFLLESPPGALTPDLKRCLNKIKALIPATK